MDSIYFSAESIRWVKLSSPLLNLTDSVKLGNCPILDFTYASVKGILMESSLRVEVVLSSFDIG